ncbi:hypothetical protein I600_1372 [Maribacter dokdonensis DSW-8]|nr:hypothetical protein I600_1372 [Maribacter dokdonensis DSW-8]
MFCYYLELPLSHVITAKIVPKYVQYPYKRKEFEHGDSNI